MGLRVLACTIARVIEHRRRRRQPAERLVVANIIPDPGDGGFTLGNDRDGGIVAMDPLASEDVALEALEYGLGHRADGADLIGER